MCCVPWSIKPEKTKTIKKNQNPEFNESFRFQIPAAEIASQTLYLQVWDWDRVSKNDPLGEVKLQLGAVDLSRTFSEVRTLTSYTGKVREKKKVFQKKEGIFTGEGGSLFFEKPSLR